MLKALLLLFFFASLSSTAQYTPKELVVKEIDDSKNYQSLTFNGIWSWFSDPRAVYFEGEHKRMYTGWVDNYGDIHVAYYDYDTKTIASKVVFDNLEIDDHNNPSILMDENGHLLVFFTSHLQDETPIYMLKSNVSESIEDWSPVKSLFLNNSENYKNAKNLSHTYTNPIKLSAEKGKIFLFWRGIDLKPTYATSMDNGETWSSGEILFLPEEYQSVRVPYTKVYSNGVSKIHFTFTDGHPTKESENALYYMYYEAGAFYKADGTKIKTIEQLPIKQNEIDLVFKQTSENIKVWNWDIAQNNNGDPVLVYTKFPDNQNHIYCYAVWKKKTWFKYDLINSGKWFPQTPKGSLEAEPNYSGGISMDHESPNTLYLSVKRNSFFEIEKWITKNEGETWNIEEITKNSIKDNIRPFVIRNAPLDNPKLLWIENTKYINYSLTSKDSNTVLNFDDRYQTAIKMDMVYPKADSIITKKSITQTARELLDWQLENPSNNIKKTNYKFGVFANGIDAFYSLTNENRYKNELLNVIQYQGEEENEMHTIKDLIWYFNTGSNRLITNKLNTITTQDIEKIDGDFRMITLLKLLSLINDDDSIDKKNLDALYLEFIDTSLIAKNNYSDSNKIYTNTLSIYCIAKGINDGLVPLDQKEELLKSWTNVAETISQKMYKNKEWDIGITGAFLLASKEIYILIDE